MTEQPLMNYFKFVNADLQVNRGGQFTEKQIARLVKADKSHKITSMVTGIFMFLVAALGVGIAVSTAMKHPGFGFTSPFGLGFGVLWPLIWGGLGVIVIRRVFSKFQIKLLKVEGPVNIVRVERSSSSTAADGSNETTYYYDYEMHIGTETFVVDDSLAGMMMQGDRYAVYYTQGSENVILSAELISKAK
jgi:hypothetical protein